MPEGYTHIRTAKHALALTKLTVSNEAAFGCGANGPDSLFCYRVWRKAAKRGENLPELGERLHNESTGLFLRTLIENAVTPDQKSYVMGFLSHYAADCTLHPYIVFLCQEGQPYEGKGGHGYSEIGIDSLLHRQDTGRPGIRVDENSPRLAGAALAGVSALLQKGIRAALDIEVSREALADTFWHTRMLRRWFYSPHRVAYAIFWLAEPFFGGRGFITAHITPAKLKKLPWPWVHPFTGEEQEDDLDDLLKKAERRSALYMLAANGYWAGRFPLDMVMELVGSASYLSGLPDELSAKGAPREQIHPTTIDF